MVGEIGDFEWILFVLLKTCLFNHFHSISKVYISGHVDKAA